MMNRRDFLKTLSAVAGVAVLPVVPHTQAQPEVVDVVLPEVTEEIAQVEHNDWQPHITLNGKRYWLAEAGLAEKSWAGAYWEDNVSEPVAYMVYCTALIHLPAELINVDVDFDLYFSGSHYVGHGRFKRMIYFAKIDDLSKSYFEIETDAITRYWT